MKLLIVGTLTVLSSACMTSDRSFPQWSKKESKNRSYQVKTAWVRQTTEKVNLSFRKANRMTPVLAGSLVIQGNGMDGVVAYERQSGAKAWTLRIPNGVEPSAALIKDRVFLGASDGNFYSLKASTGQVLWTFLTKSEILSAPLLEDGNVYFLAGNNVFYALDAATGKQNWLYSRQDTAQFSIRGGSRAAYKSGVLYIGFSDGSLVAINAKSGSVQWELQLNKNKRFRDVDSTPVIDGDFLYIAGYDDKLYCVSTSKGEVLWSVDGGGYSAVTLMGDKLIYPTSSGEVVALKKSNGNKVWSYSLSEGIATQVVDFQGVVVFGESQGKLLFLDPLSGSKLGSVEPGRGILGTPQVDPIANRVYFISGEANLYAVDAGWSKNITN